MNELLSRIKSFLISRYTRGNAPILILMGQIDLLKRISPKLKDRKATILVSDSEIYSLVKKWISHPLVTYDYSLPLHQCPSIGFKQFQFISDFNGFGKAFQSPDKLNQVLQNVRRHLKVGGYLVVIGLSGERTNTVLSLSPEVKRYHKGDLIWKMKKKYSEWSLTQPNFNRSVQLSLGKGSPREEVLIDFDYLIRVAPHYQLEVILSVPLEKFQREHSISSPNSTYYEEELAYHNDLIVLRRIEMPLWE